MLTKNDLSQIKAVVRETIQPEIHALKQSTKKDMKSLERRLIERIDEAQMEIISSFSFYFLHYDDTHYYS